MLSYSLPLGALAPGLRPRTGAAMDSEQPRVEPGDGLQEGLLLGPALVLLARVAADREAMHDATVQVDLVRLAALGQDLLGLVALLGGEDLVRLGGGDGQRRLEALQLLLVDERGVGEEAALDVWVVAGDVL